ncbi:MAG TPA: class I SAM-dependent methyltransferase [Thermoanaerobaculia bacterium]|nr:class I SAM-dependent methyltransferase [Thermoanaerobaculia bacterium]
MNAESPRRRWARAYARLRRTEGRGAGGEAELLALPYLASGPLAGQWAVRARSFDALKSRVVVPLAKERAKELAVLDLGAGNGWLCARLARDGHRCVALDLRLDDVDGLAAGAAFRRHLPRMFGRVSASFDALPFSHALFDLVVFDASLHLAEDLGKALAEAARATAPGGRVAILDSPFYARRASGEAMAEEKRRDTARSFRDLAGDLLALTAVEYLTRETLERAAAPAGLSFVKLRVLYPLAYETRGVKARLLGRREPSRFDLWVAART